MKEIPLTIEEKALYREALSRYPIIRRVHRLAAQNNPVRIKPNKAENTMESVAIDGSYSQGWDDHAEFIEEIDLATPESADAGFMDTSKH